MKWLTSNWLFIPLVVGMVWMHGGVTAVTVVTAVGTSRAGVRTASKPPASSTAGTLGSRSRPPGPQTIPSGPRAPGARGRVMDGLRDGLILLEIPPGVDEHFDVSFLERTGHPVEVCRGPQERPCPLLGGESCPKFESAHGIVFELDLDRAEHRTISERYRALTGGDRPIRVVVDPGQAECYRDVLAGIEIWTHEPTVADLDGFADRVEATDR